MASRYQRRHYEDMANLINDLMPEDVPADDYPVMAGIRHGLILTANRMIELFKEDNPNFDVVRFEKACGL